MKSSNGTDHASPPVDFGGFKILSSDLLVVINYGFIEHLGVHFLTGIARSGLEPGTSVSETR